MVTIVSKVVILHNSNIGNGGWMSDAMVSVAWVEDSKILHDHKLELIIDSTESFLSV